MAKNKFKNKSKRKNVKFVVKNTRGDCNKKQSNEQTAKNAFVAFRSENTTTGDSLYLDSGASAHMTPNRGILSIIKSTKVDNITAANGDGMRVKDVGSTLLNISDNEIVANNVLHVPQLSVKLLSVSKIVENGNEVIFSKNGCVIRNESGAVIAKCKAEIGVYKILMKRDNCLLTKKHDTAYTWHRRLGHVNYEAVQKNEERCGARFEF